MIQLGIEMIRPIAKSYKLSLELFRELKHDVFIVLLSHLVG